jgi:CNT family concentrative nucleoside transporter
VRPFFGIAALLALAWALSEDRNRIPWRTVMGGIVLQWALAVLLIELPWARAVLFRLDDAATALQTATDSGTGFVFGYLGGANLPFHEVAPGASFILAFKALPLVLVISALASLLYYLRILQIVMQAFAWLLRRVMWIDGPLALGATVHIFVGMIEAPLLVRPYLARMQRGELFALMTCGMAGVAGTVMVIYATLLSRAIPDALGNILVASVISTPAALAVAGLMVPFGPIDGKMGAGRAGALVMHDPPVSVMDAITKGVMDGIMPLVSIVAMLLVLIALVTLVNMGLANLPYGLTLQGLFAWPFRLVMWLIGIPWPEVPLAASLMATKTVLNEFVAYLDLSHLPLDSFAPRSRLILTYALCGFANFGSLGIMIGGLGAMVPELREEVVRLGLRSIFSGTIATCLSGAVAGILT